MVAHFHVAEATYEQAEARLTIASGVNKLETFCWQIGFVVCSCEPLKLCTGDAMKIGIKAPHAKYLRVIMLFPHMPRFRPYDSSPGSRFMFLTFYLDVNQMYVLH